MSKTMVGMLTNLRIPETEPTWEGKGHFRWGCQRRREQQRLLHEVEDEDERAFAPRASLR